MTAAGPMADQPQGYVLRIFCPRGTDVPLLPTGSQNRIMTVLMPYAKKSGPRVRYYDDVLPRFRVIGWFKSSKFQNTFPIIHPCTLYFYDTQRFFVNSIMPLVLAAAVSTHRTLFWNSEPSWWISPFPRRCDGCWMFSCQFSRFVSTKKIWSVLCSVLYQLRTYQPSLISFIAFIYIYFI